VGTKSLPELTALICQLKLIHTDSIWIVLRIQVSDLVSMPQKIFWLVKGIHRNIFSCMEMGGWSG
jgi:hypothetical protein